MFISLSRLNTLFGVQAGGAGTSGAIKVIGFWDASTNTPNLSSLTLSQGEAYLVSVPGNTNLNGETNWRAKDLVVWYDSLVGNWFKIDNTDDVISVNGLTGVVDLGVNDLNDADTLTSPPSINDILQWDGANWVPGSTSSFSGVYGSERHYAEDSADTISTANFTTSPTKKCFFTTSSLPAGLYKVEANFSYLMKKDRYFNAGIWDGNSYVKGPIDYRSDEDDNKLYQTIVIPQISLSGVSTFELHFGSRGSGDPATCGNATLELIRVG
jgi:hypothetical protein